MSDWASIVLTLAGLMTAAYGIEGWVNRRERRAERRD